MNCNTYNCGRIGIPRNINGKEYLLCEQCYISFMDGLEMGIKMGERIAQEAEE